MSADGNWENAIKQLFTTDCNLVPCQFLTPSPLMAQLNNSSPSPPPPVKIALFLSAL